MLGAFGQSLAKPNRVIDGGAHHGGGDRVVVGPERPHAKARRLEGNRPTARHRVEDEVTVKRLRRKAGRAYLVAENPDFAPIVVDLERTPLVIEGIALGVVRDLGAV